MEIYLTTNDINITKYLLLKCGAYTDRIDSLSMLIKDRNTINVIFRGWDISKNKANIFKSNICLSKNLNIITNSNSNSYNNPYTTYCDDDKAYILICQQYENGNYLLYDLLENSTISNINIPNTSNISLIKYNKQPVVFYNKTINKDILLKYRFLNLEGNDGKLEDEKNISIPKNIIKPRISIYRKNAFIIWYSNTGLNIASSKDLRSWNLNYFNGQENTQFIKTNMIKVREEKVENIKTFIKYIDFKNILKNRKERNAEVNYNNQLFKLLYYTNDFKNKADNLQKCISINKYYESKNKVYINKILEMQKIIDEKDELIMKLLSKK